MIFPADDALVKTPRPTPLFSATAASSEANLWTSVNGWSVPRVYSSLEEEYIAAKKKAVIADLCPIARYAVRGKEAGVFLARLTTAPAARLEPGESARGLILDDNGYVVDLAEVSRLSTDLFLLATPTAHARRLQLTARGMNVAAENISDDIAAIGVFGKGANDVLAAAGMKSPGDSVAASGMMRGVETAARPVQFSALPGIELIFPKEEALTVWERLVRRGHATPIGLDALEVLRLESGGPRPGVDFIAADRARSGGARTPEELGLNHLAPLDRGWFSGRRGLRTLAGKPVRRLISLAVDDEKSMPGAAVFSGGRIAGRVTSCAWSPAVKRVIAFADVSASSGGKDYEISVPAPSEGRVSARVYETAESALARSDPGHHVSATESGSPAV